MSKYLQDWLGFGLGGLLGLLLAFVFYAGLQPRVKAAVERQEKVEQDSLAARQTRASQAALAVKKSTASKSNITAPPAPKSAAAGNSSASKPANTPVEKQVPVRIRATQLQPTSTADGGRGRNTGLALLTTAVLAAVAVSSWAWAQRQKYPQPDVVKSKVLEALLTLKAHQQMQQRLGLTPRQIKRFNSKARVQHSQLQAMARRGQQSEQTSPAFTFPVSGQIQAFQLLLLLEESRQQQQPLLQAKRAEFIRQLQEAYAQHTELTDARRAAADSPALNKSGDAAAADQFAALNQQLDPRLLEQLYEMNIGLLA
jgi:hypothetical protein